MNILPFVFQYPHQSRQRPAGHSSRLRTTRRTSFWFYTGQLRYCEERRGGGEGKEKKR